MRDLVLVATGVLLGWSLTGLLVRALRRRRHVAQPNERSLHATAVPVGGGLAIIAAMLVLWPIWAAPLSGPHRLILGVAAALSVVSWIDDLRPLWPATRLVLQTLAVTVGLAALPAEVRLLAGLPLVAERVLIALAWIWFVNLFNFMDGIDGLAGSEGATIAVGYVGVAAMLGEGGPLVALALLLAAAAAGYLVWNWHPAAIFMGDAGSIPLGFLLGFLMLDLARRGQPAAGVILPLYFVADATLTLLRRLARGEMPWCAHREHFYQQAVLGGATHAAITLRITAVNVVLLVLALVSVRYPAIALTTAAIVVAGLLDSLRRTGISASSPPPRA